MSGAVEIIEPAFWRRAAGRFCLVCLLAAWPTAASTFGAGDNEDELLVHVPFDDSVKAAYAKGNASAKESPHAPKFVDGVAGKAIVLADDRLAYELKDNFNPRRGAVMLWIQPLRWDPMKTNEYNYFFNACRTGVSGGDKLQFFKLPNPMLYLTLGKAGADQTLPTEIRSWRKGEWRCFAFTWDTGWLKLYVNGELAGKTAIAEDQLPSHVGEEMFCSITDATVIDELRVFGKPLAPERVKHYFLADYLKRNTPEPLAAVGTTNATAPVRLKTVVPFLARPPAEAPDEWRRATEITGFLEIPALQWAPRQTTVKLAYDADNLYCRFGSKITQKPKAEVKEHDGAVYTDDSFEIFLAPSPTAAKPLYQLVFNSLDAHYDSKDGDPSWNGNWRSRSRVSAAEWEAEAVIPFRELGVAPPRPGEEWQFNFGRNWSRPSAFTTVTFNLAYSDVTRFARFVFGGTNVAVRATQTLATDEKGAQGAFVAPVSGAYVITHAIKKPLQTILDKGSITSFDAIPGALLADEKKSVQALEGDTCNFDFSTRLQAEGQYFASLRILSPQGELFNQVTPFQVERALDVTLTALSKDGKLVVSWELNREIGTPFDLSMALVNSAGKETASRKEKVAAARKGEQVFDLALFPDKEYAVRISARGNLGAFEQTEKWLSFRNAEWLGFGKKLAAGHIVPKPWKAIAVLGDNRIQTLQTESRFADGPFPQQMAAAKEDLLAGPVALIVTANRRLGGTDHQELSFDPGQRKWIEKFPDRVAFQQDCKSRDLDLTTKVSAEFDGLLRFDVALRPRKKSGVMISGLALEVPLKPECATLKYPYAGHRQKWGVMDLEGEVRDDWKESFLPHLWIGNDERGVAWFAESDESFRLRDPTRAIEIMRTDRRTIMRIRMVDQPIELAAPMNFTFGLMATPARPLPESWSATRFASCVGTTTRPIVSTGYTTGAEYHAKPGLPYPALDAQRFIKSLSKEAGVKNLVYVTSNGVGDNVPEYRYYNQEWRNPACRDTWTYAIRGFYHDCVCPASESWRDFFLFSTEKAIAEYNIDGFYYDYGTVMQDTNPVYCGYRRDGKTAPTYPIFADRELRKLIYILFQEKGKDPWFILHNYSQMMAPLASFCHMILDGEPYQQRLGGVGQKVTNDYSQLLTMPRLRAMFGIQFGTAPVFLPKLAAEDWNNPKPTRTLVAWTLPLGIQPWGFNCNIPELNKLCAAQDQFGIGASEFFPFWKHSAIFTTQGNGAPPLHISFWKKKNAALVAFSNLSDQPFDGLVVVNIKSLGGRTTGKLTAADGYSGETMPVNAGAIQLRIAEKDFRLVGFKISE
ncbi:MAG: hypothetical protein HY360_05975 [Verrucomicrobia bacterium]|nr:hypothetical protein [Verrucomicrobiota bacterium]